VSKLKFKVVEAVADQVKLDLGAGKGANTPEGFEKIDFPTDLRKPWPWKDNSVDEVNCNYVIQYLTGQERIHFFNELYRVLKPGAKARIDTPYWCAAKAYSDPTVQWPPVSEWFYPMLSKAYRAQQNFNDTTGLKCDFEHTLGYGMHPMVSVRNQERQQEMVAFSKEAAQDLICTVTKSG